MSIGRGSPQAAGAKVRLWPKPPFEKLFRNGSFVPHHAIWDDDASSKSKRFEAANFQDASEAERNAGMGGESAYSAG